MPKYVLTHKAVADLSNIWNYTFDNWSEAQADKYYNEILSKCSKLAQNPDEGKMYFSLLEGLRGAKINKHIIFFREISEKVIEIERILHEQMDLRARLEE